MRSLVKLTAIIILTIFTASSENKKKYIVINYPRKRETNIYFFTVSTLRAGALDLFIPSNRITAI